MRKFLSVAVILLISNAFAGEQFRVEHAVRLCDEDDPTIFIQNAANEDCLIRTGIPKAKLVSPVMIDVGPGALGGPRYPVNCSLYVTKKVSAFFECEDK